MRSRTLTLLSRSALYGTLVTWGTVSFVRQLTREGPALFHKLDPYALLVPNYHFFCPEPARHDQNLMYRDKLADGDLGPWQEIVTTYRRRMSHMVWYPHHRLDKGMMDVANEILRFGRMNGNDLARLSVTRPYLSILNMVTYSVEHDARAVQTQFAIGHSAAYEPDVEPTIAFVSNFHALPRAELRRTPV
jgi:hypothetical protein